MNSLLIVSSLAMVGLLFLNGRETFARVVASPYGLFAIFFVTPLLLNRLELSLLQVSAWSLDSYILVFCSLLMFGYFPFFLLKLVRRSGPAVKIIGNPVVRRQHVVHALMFGAAVLQLLVNFEISGGVLPALNVSRVDQRIHTTEGVGTIATIGVALWYAIGFHYFCDMVETWSGAGKKRIFIFLLFIALPLTRLARFDVVSLVAACVIYLCLRDKIRGKQWVAIAVGILASVVFGAFIAKFRWGGGDADAVSFAESIAYTGISGPYDVFAFLYAYYPLSFENIDRIVNPSVGSIDASWGAMMLSPLTIGVLKLGSFFPELDPMPYFESIRDPLHGLATVPTALPAFAVDFGVGFSWIPMLVYSLIGTLLYIRANGSWWASRMYPVFAIGYIHMPFLNHFVQPLTGVILVATALMPVIIYSSNIFSKNLLGATPRK